MYVDLDNELRMLRERVAVLERRMESRIQDDGGGASALPDVIRFIKFPLAGIGGGQVAYVDWLAGGGWQTGAAQMEVTSRAPASLVMGAGLDPRTGDRRTGYAAWNAQCGTWDALGDWC